MNPTLYDILGVSADASREEIRKAWREAADRFEPGEGGSTKQFRLFNQAAEVLLDPERRRAYDAELAGRTAVTGDATKSDAEPAEPEAAKGDATKKAAEPEAAKGDATKKAAEPAEPEPAKSQEPGKAGSANGAAGAAAAPAEVPRDGGAKEREAADEPVSLAKTSAKEPGDSEEESPAGAAVPGPPVPGAARATTVAVGVEPAAAAGTSRGGRTPAWLLLAALGVLAAVAVGFAAYFITQAERAEAYQDAVDRAPAAAESAASAVLSYDYKSLEADRDAASKYLSDEYRSKYVDTFDKLVSENATKTKATVEAQVLASSAMAVGEDRDPDRVPVLLFVNQTTTSAATTGQPAVALNRVRFDMVEVDGTWLVDDITSY